MNAVREGERFDWDCRPTQFLLRTCGTMILTLAVAAEKKPDVAVGPFKCSALNTA